MNNFPDKSAATLAHRKAQLVAESQAYRDRIINAVQLVQTSLGAESLAKSALGTIASIGFALLRRRGSFGGIGLQTILPLLMRGLSVLSKKISPKPLLRASLIAGAVGTFAGLIIKKMKSAKAAKSQSTSR